MDRFVWSADDIEVLEVEPRQHAQHRAQPSRVDYALIARELDGVEDKLRKDLRAVIQASLDATVAAVRRGFDPLARSAGKQARTFHPPKLTAPLKVTLRDGLLEATSAGGATVRREVPQGRRVQFAFVPNQLGGVPKHAISRAKFREDHYSYASKVTTTPQAAVRAMRDKALWVSGVLDEQLTSRAQSILVQAVKNGESVGETVRKIQEAWLPWVGDESIIEDEEQLQPYRLETLVRTNVTDAYNTGRLAEMRDPDLQEWMQGVRYSAVLDERTTELCEGLNDLVFRVDDPDLDRLTPPNHYNCRSILVPVLIDEEVDAEDFATQRDVGEALDLMDAGFGGAAKYEEGGWDESKHPRVPAGGSGGGQFGPGGGGAAAAGDKGKSRAALALHSHKPSTAKKQQWGERNEGELRRMIGGKQSGDNLPLDLTTTIDGKLHGVEVKTFLDNGNDKVTVHPASRERKEAWARSNRARVHTVVFDDRDAFGSPGHSGHKLYYRRGVGAFRLASMTKVTSAAHLRRLMTK